jgi:hypothetical protein
VNPENSQLLKFLDFSRLEFGAKVAAGATATVYKGNLDGDKVCLQPSSPIWQSKEVAIKLFYCNVLDANTVKDFVAEAQLMR